jgi:hypothetical protein
MTQEKVMLLIDADNVSLDVIEQAVGWVGKHFGGPHVRRAYCTAESAVKHQAAFKRLSIRPMVNLAAGKNSTDIALAVDAIDLTLAERPDVVVIASSDSDFAPLVSRLREKGCRVIGIGQQGKTGDETRAVYDDYEVMEHRKAKPQERSAPRGRAATRGREAPREREGSRDRAASRERADTAPVAPPEAVTLAAPTPVPPAEPRAARPRSRGGRRKPQSEASAGAQAAPEVAREAAPAPAPEPVAPPSPSESVEQAKPARKPRRRRSSPAKRSEGGGAGPLP